MAFKHPSALTDSLLRLAPISPKRHCGDTSEATHWITLDPPALTGVLVAFATVAGYVTDKLFHRHRARIAFRPPRDHADKPKLDSACSFKLVGFIAINKNSIPGAEVVPLVPEQNSACAASDDHSVLMPMPIERRFSAGRNREVADDKVRSSFGNTHQDLLGNSCRCVGAIVTQRNGRIRPDG